MHIGCLLDGAFYWKFCGENGKQVACGSSSVLDVKKHILGVKRIRAIAS